jgi:hypothetical protein
VAELLAFIQDLRKLRPTTSQHRAELPSLKAIYERYHDRGFDVVGISLDADRQALEAFLEKEQLPWVTLHGQPAGVQRPLAEYYGIMTIPTRFLVDSDRLAWLPLAAHRTNDRQAGAENRSLLHGQRNGPGQFSEDTQRSRPRPSDRVPHGGYWLALWR